MFSWSWRLFWLVSSLKYFDMQKTDCGLICLWFALIIPRSIRSRSKLSCDKKSKLDSGTLYFVVPPAFRFLVLVLCLHEECIVYRKLALIYDVQLVLAFSEFRRLFWFLETFCCLVAEYLGRKWVQLTDAYHCLEVTPSRHRGKSTSQVNISSDGIGPTTHICYDWTKRHILIGTQFSSKAVEGLEYWVLHI